MLADIRQHFFKKEAVLIIYRTASSYFKRWLTKFFDSIGRDRCEKIN